MIARPDPAADLRRRLRAAADPAKAVAVQRYFHKPVAALGVPNAQVDAIASSAIATFDLSPAQRIELAEDLIAAREYHEDVMLAFSLVRAVGQRYARSDLLETFERWLREAVSNWAQCDDLCLKAIYQLLLGHPAAIPRVAEWTKSSAPWVRRAGNVALVKFVKPRIGSDTYRLPIEIVLDNANRLLDDPDEHVQKSVGWLLKVAAAEHPDSVLGFLAQHVTEMNRCTFRCALEHVDPEVRQAMLALKR